MPRSRAASVSGPSVAAGRVRRLWAQGAAVVLAGAVAYGSYRLAETWGLTRSHAALQGLPLVEVRARGRGFDDLMVVFLSADGGWAGLDRGVAARLARAGIPTVGWNSLRYYATRRTPRGAAADLARILRYYPRAWGRERVVLVGYSWGADVLPFLVNRLPPPLRAHVVGVALLAFGSDAEWEFHPRGWLIDMVGPHVPTLPEVRRIRDLPIVCIYGRGDRSADCEPLRAQGAQVVATDTGHQLGAQSDRVAALLLRSIRAWEQRADRAR